MSVLERGRQHADVIWLDCIGGPAHGTSTFPYGITGTTRHTPTRGEQVTVLSGAARAVYVCRYTEDRG